MKKVFGFVVVWLLLFSNVYSAPSQRSANDLVEIFIDFLLTSPDPEAVDFAAQLDSIANTSAWQNALFFGDPIAVTDLVPSSVLEDAAVKLERFLNVSLYSLIRDYKEWGSIADAQLQGYFGVRLRREISYGQAKAIAFLCASFKKSHLKELLLNRRFGHLPKWSAEDKARLVDLIVDRNLDIKGGGWNLDSDVSNLIQKYAGDHGLVKKDLEASIGKILSVYQALEPEWYGELVKGAVTTWKANLSWIRREAGFQFLTLKFPEEKGVLGADVQAIQWGSPLRDGHIGRALGLQNELTLVWGAQNGSQQFSLIYFPGLSSTSMQGPEFVPQQVEIAEAGQSFQLKPYRGRTIAGPFVIQFHVMGGMSRHLTFKFLTKTGAIIPKRCVVVDLVDGGVLTYEGSSQGDNPITLNQLVRQHLRPLLEQSLAAPDTNGTGNGDGRGRGTLDLSRLIESGLTLERDGSMIVEMAQWDVAQMRLRDESALLQTWSPAQTRVIRQALRGLERGMRLKLPVLPP
ncbi:MAG: hypothetical protein HY390_08140 [Deltaproteobacteria bacterium]|nr:hypothetical protein [Deltaproteobacteria bacterium]